MRVRWFGEPWPDAELRAPICEDDAHRVEVPVGIHCLECGKPIGPDDQGIVMAYGGGLKDDVTFTVALEVGEYLVCAEHLDCMLYATLGVDPRDRA